MSPGRRRTLHRQRSNARAEDDRWRQARPGDAQRSNEPPGADGWSTASRAAVRCSHDRFAELARRAVHLHGRGDPAAAWVASRQHGVIDAGQCRLCGLGATAVTRRVRRGLWRRLQRGVFLVGAQQPDDHARVLAAVMSRGAGAVAGHATGAWLWGADDRLAAVIDVTVPLRRHPRSHPGIRLHRSGRPFRVMWRHGIPVTPVARTLVDCAATLPAGELEAVCALALRLGLVKADAIRAELDDVPRRPGCVALARMLADGPRLTRSALERRMCALIAAAGLPPPELNARVCGREADLYWPGHRVVVEVDAFGTHGAPSSFESDRLRDADMAAAGIGVLRFTRTRIEREPHLVVARLAAVLAVEDRRPPAAPAAARPPAAQPSSRK